MHFWQLEKYKIGTGLLALAGAVLALSLDRWKRTTLMEYPLSANVFATALGVAFPVFFGALFFDRWKAAEEARKKSVAAQEQRVRELVAITAETLSPLLARARAVLKKIPLLGLGAGLESVSKQLNHLKDDESSRVLLPLSELRKKVPKLDELALVAAAVPQVSKAIDELAEPLPAIRSLGGVQIRDAAASVNTAIEDFWTALPADLVDYAPLMARLRSEREGTWDGTWVETPKGGFRVTFENLERLASAAEDLVPMLDRLDHAIAELAAVAQQELRMVA